MGQLIGMAIQPISPRGHHRPRRLMRRLDRVTSQMNPYLFAVAIGLVVLYATCLGALIFRLPATIHVRTCAVISAPTDTSEAQSK
jgi:hypothetical protein